MKVHFQGAFWVFLLVWPFFFAILLDSSVFWTIFATWRIYSRFQCFFLMHLIIFCISPHIWRISQFSLVLLMIIKAVRNYSVFISGYCLEGVWEANWGNIGVSGRLMEAILVCQAVTSQPEVITHRNHPQIFPGKEIHQHHKDFFTIYYSIMTTAQYTGNTMRRRW